eukprot:CAMPEP_0170408564 /NCGR_PEP_ID=MMETSP0117_2-20130122/28862_1 /TAXON_ID=400756 /ORGANISM="Durinskia baltica, Strain CSIRO CS-38" /LENGTH=126 /DNA_ID=CAMNT_0010665915 /DNA_START=152 /DNA_END=529 /DNA_ORIENTATION=-
MPRPPAVEQVSSLLACFATASFPAALGVPRLPQSSPVLRWHRHARPRFEWRRRRSPLGRIAQLAEVRDGSAQRAVFSHFGRAARSLCTYPSVLHAPDSDAPRAHECRLASQKAFRARPQRLATDHP